MGSYAGGTAEALAAIADALDSIDHTMREQLGAGERLRLVQLARVQVDRAAALLATLVGEADAAGAAERAAGTPLTSWLALDGRTARKDASRLVFSGRDVGTHPRVRDAALAGVITVDQARGISRAMGELPQDLTTDQQSAAQDLLLRLACSTPAHRLARLGPTVLEAVAPSHPDNPADATERAASDRRRALKRRRLSWRPDGEGSVLFEASLPEVEASAFIKLVESYVETGRNAARTAEDRRDPHTFPTSIDQRRADALVGMVIGHNAGRRSPGLAGDRPRVVVTMREADLRERAERAGVLDSGALVAAGTLRRLCCDADLMPVVLGGRSEILDVGTVSRLVTPPIRRALALRDTGCAFPGCDAPESLCDAHHVEPWWKGGTTSLGNMVLLCPHHHAIVEPPRFWAGAPPPDRWEVRLDSEGYPEFIPPVTLDPARRPLRHVRPRPAA